MMDCQHLPRSTVSDAQFFRLPFEQVWHKPRTARMIYIFALSSGGGGGAGLTGAAGSSRGGGGGGGAGAATTLLIPADFIPDRLYVLPGAGGAGGSGSGVAGSGGAQTFVSFDAVATAGISAALLLTAANGQAGGGAAGTSGGANSGGAVATAWTTANSSQWVQATGGVLQFFVDTGTSPSGTISGANGGVGAGPNMWSLARWGHGCGGASVGTNNTDFAGGAYGTSGGGIIPALQGGAAGGGRGCDGYNLTDPYLMLTGGSGGGSFGSGGGSVGGAGGNGGNGCGGGGGGGGVTGGKGGNGGDGLVIIVCW